MGIVVLNRREFLKAFTAAAAGVLAVGKGSRLSAFAASEDAYDLLVVGDSLIWGQGLKEEDKIYTLTAEWLRTQAFGGPRKVDMKLKAHSGSTITFHKDEAEKYKKVGRDETYYYPPEVNVSFPSITKQIEVAADEYKAAGNAKGADLIVLSGGLTDISVAGILNPNGDNAVLVKDIERYCRRDMIDLLKFAIAKNPDATVVVLGYFPMISNKTSSSRLLDSWLESMSFPRFFKPFVNNPLVRAIYFNKLRNRAIKRSKIWIAESDKNLKLAVEAINSEFRAGRAVFVPSPVTDETTLETPNSYLFKMGKKGRSEDPLYDERAGQCRAGLKELKTSTGIEFPIRYCEIAGVGHPNPSGAKAYAQAIAKVLSPVLIKQ
jgi:hypothetical protein